MELQDLLEQFNKGEAITDPAIYTAMREYIAENRRLLFDMNHNWHENEAEIIESFQLGGKDCVVKLIV